MLSDSGHIFITVPDASRYAYGEDAPFQEFSPEHINFFGPISITNLMRISGFTSVAYEQDTIRVNYLTSTTVLHAVYRKRTHTSSPPPLAPDTQTGIGLVTYINQSRQDDDQIRQTINGVVARGKPIIVWGAGSHTLRLLAASRLGQA